MLDYPVSDTLKGLLGRQKALVTTAGTDVSSMMKWANALIDREEMIEAGHPPAGAEETHPMGLKLVFSNTQSVRRGGRKLCLVLIEGGKR